MWSLFPMVSWAFSLCKLLTQHCWSTACNVTFLTESISCLLNNAQTGLDCASAARHCLPVGLYLVSAGTDSLLVLWDVSQRKALNQRSTPATVSAVSWHPDHNSLACVSEEGSVAVWSDIVPGDHPGPHVSPDSLPAHGVASHQEGGGERAGSVDPLGRQAHVWMCKA